MIRLPEQVAEGVCRLESPSNPLMHPSSVVFPHVAVVDLVADAEKRLAECLSIKQLRIFALDPEILKIWHVGRTTDGTTGRISRVRRYANATSSVCAIALHCHDIKIVLEPAVEPTFNDTVDITGGAGGIYLAPIISPWSTHPMGMVQVARSTRAVFGSSTISKQPSELSEAGAATAFAREREREQKVEDDLVIELLEIFCRVFAGLLLHARAQQLHSECPEEIRNAKLAFLSDRLSWLESEQELEQVRIDEQLAEVERCATANSSMEQRILDSIQREKLPSSHSRQATPMSTTSLERRSSSGEQVMATSSELSPITASRRISSAGSHFRTQTPLRFPPENLPVAEPDEADTANEESSSDEGPSGFEGEPPQFSIDDSSCLDPAEVDGYSSEHGLLLIDSTLEQSNVDGNEHVDNLTVGWDSVSLMADGEDNGSADGYDLFVPDELGDGESPSDIGEHVSTPGSAYGGLISTDSAYSIDLQ